MTIKAITCRKKVTRGRGSLSVDQLRVVTDHKGRTVIRARIATVAYLWPKEWVGGHVDYSHRRCYAADRVAIYPPGFVFPEDQQ